MASKPATKAKPAAAPKAAAKKPTKPVMTAAKKPGKTAAPKASPAAPAAPVMAAAKKPAATAARTVSPKAAAKAPPKAAPKKPAETVTLKTVFEQIGETHGLSKKQALAMATELVDQVTGILKAGDRVRLSGLGILEVKDRPAHPGRNPATGEAIQIAASKKVAFRAAKELKEAV